MQLVPAACHNYSINEYGNKKEQQAVFVHSSPTKNHPSWTGVMSGCVTFALQRSVLLHLYLYISGDRGRHSAYVWPHHTQVKRKTQNSTLLNVVYLAVFSLIANLPSFVAFNVSL